MPVTLLKTTDAFVSWTYKMATDNKTNTYTCVL